MQFLNPIWLWGLTGLMIPIGIHLLSRKEGKVIRIGSIRHLEETNTRQFRNIRLNELLLLVLRCLLIILIVILLSGLTFNSSKSKGINWLLIEKGIENESDFKTLMDSLEKKEFELRWLAKDFPLLKDSSAIKASTNYWSLIESMEAQQIKQIVVLSYNYAIRFKGRRSSVPDNVRWISKNPAPIDFILSATRTSYDSILVRKGKSSSEGTSFTNEYNKANVNQSVLDEDNSMMIKSEDTISVSLYSDSQFQYDKEIILAALKSVDETMPYVFRIKTLPIEKWKADEKTNCTIWLSEKAITKTGSHNRIVYNKNKFEANNLLTLSESGWSLNERLDEGNALNKNLTLQLAEILLPKDNALQRAKEFDKRALSEKLLWSSAALEENKKSIAFAGTSTVLHYLAFLILITLVTERIVAFKRNQ